MSEIEVLKEIRGAIKEGNTARVSELFGSYPEFIQKDTAFGSWLHVAAHAGKLEVVKRLVELGADVNRRGGILTGTPINEASSEGHIAVVQYLLTHGARLDVAEPEQNPLFSAIRGGHLEIVRLLVDSGIDLHVKYTGESMKNMDALAFARERGQQKIANLLLNLL